MQLPCREHRALRGISPLKFKMHDENSVKVFCPPLGEEAWRLPQSVERARITPLRTSQRYNPSPTTMLTAATIIVIAFKLKCTISDGQML